MKMYSEWGRYVINIAIYISRKILFEHPSMGLALLAQEVLYIYIYVSLFLIPMGAITYVCF